VLAFAGVNMVGYLSWYIKITYQAVGLCMHECFLNLFKENTIEAIKVQTKLKQKPKTLELLHNLAD